MKRRTAGFRERYGSSPLPLLLTLGSFALTLYAGVRLLEGDAYGVAMWFIGGAVLHDLVLLPLYTVVDRGVQVLLRSGARPGEPAAAAVRWINFLRVPAFVSGLLLLVWFPLILDQVGHYQAYTGLPGGVFFKRWLLASAALFGASAVWLLARMWRVRPRRPSRRARRRERQ